MPGIVGTALEPPTKAVGQAWPIKRSTRTLNGCDAVTVSWFVFVILPAGDPGAPVDMADQLELPISRALYSAGLTVEMWEPWEMTNWQQVDSAIPVLRYSVFD